jgi:hypothetical protein
VNSSITRSAKEKHSIAVLRHDIERAAEKTVAVYGSAITPLGLFMAELAVICEAAPLYVRLNLEACIATFETRNAPGQPADKHRPLHPDTGSL